MGRPTVGELIHWLRDRIPHWNSKAVRMVINKKQAILLSVVCLWFATAFIISCYHGKPARITLEDLQRRSDGLPPLYFASPLSGWKFHWPSENRYHEDLTKLGLLVLPVFAICVPLWFNFRDSVPVSPAA